MHKLSMKCDFIKQLSQKPTESYPELASMLWPAQSHDIVYKLPSLKNKLYIITCRLNMFGMLNPGIGTGKRGGILRGCAPLNHPDLQARVIDDPPITLAWLCLYQEYIGRRAECLMHCACPQTPFLKYKVHLCMFSATLMCVVIKTSIQEYARWP